MTTKNDFILFRKVYPDKGAVISDIIDDIRECNDPMINPLARFLPNPLTKNGIFIVSIQYKELE
jgi:hypothetical protein